jgi:hypothetical protein
MELFDQHVHESLVAIELAAFDSAVSSMLIIREMDSKI